MTNNRLSTGVDGLDSILCGGLIPNQAYLLRGGPGTGKTTLGCHFLSQATAEEPALWISLGEVESQLRRNAQNLGFDLQHVHVLDLSPSAEFFTEDKSYDIFLPAEVERESITHQIISIIQSLQPKLVFVDSVTQFRYLASDRYQFHQQVLAFIRYLTDQHVTSLFTSESCETIPDADLQFLSDGVISLHAVADRRIIEVTKFRGSGFIEGEHFCKLTKKGLQVFPALVPDDFKQTFDPRQVSSGVPDLDELLHGGLERGTVTVVSGPTGVGKTTFGFQFMKEAAGQGIRSVVYTFEETKEMIIHRCEGINIPVRTMVEQGTLSIKAIEALALTPAEFADMVRREVEEHGTQIVMLDSISGYRMTIRGEQLITHIHALCRYLQNMGVTTLLINELENITGDFNATGKGISYLADNIVFLRYLEVQGNLKKAIGVLKKRLSSYEQTLREFEITRYGIRVGRPLVNLRNILSGTPDWVVHKSSSDEGL